MWQAAYSELVFVPIHWPDFDKAALEGRDRRICQAGAPLRRSGRENRIVTEGEAAPAAVAEQGSRNLLMRVRRGAGARAARRLRIAYAGGWLWTALVTLAAIGLYRRMAGDRRRGTRERAWSRPALSRLR